MTLKQIRDIKSNFNGLKLNTSLTGMFSNNQWASVWSIEFIMPNDMKKLLNYLDDNELCYFFGIYGLDVQ